MKQLNTQDIMSKVSSLKDNSKVLLAVLAVVFLIDGFILVRFQFMPLLKMWSEARKIKTEIVQARLDSKSTDNFKSRLKDLKAEIDVLQKKAVDESDLQRILENISKYAELSSVKILKIRPMSEARARQKPIEISKTEQLIREKISITAVSGFHELGRFLGLLESSPIFFDIRKLDIRAGSEEYRKHSITIFLDVVLRKS